MNHKQTNFFTLAIFALKPGNLFCYEAERTLKCFPEFSDLPQAGIAQKANAISARMVRAVSSPVAFSGGLASENPLSDKALQAPSGFVG
ncbi:hypothetical protein [Caballeronia terrestris]|uniref:hypothetical protein n=1 Tax=Caballeronia terrestris TaxID=1226301 RepID=UPI000ACB6D25|nr:hypothetical protein [Caballeronia terrestris]